MEKKTLKVRLDKFDPTQNFSRGRTKLIEAAWYAFKCVVFMSPLPWPNVIKVKLLRLFGAKIGVQFRIQPRVAIHFPWKLEVGAHCWIGQRCELLNFEPIILGDHVALAHDVYIATGNHDYTDSSMPYMNRPVMIGSGSWIASRAFIGPGVVIGEHSVVGAGSVVTNNVPSWRVASGNPAKVIRERKLKK